eukprot:4523742-Amphidinium_carterae.1
MAFRDRPCRDLPFSSHIQAHASIVKTLVKRRRFAKRALSVKCPQLPMQESGDDRAANAPQQEQC